MDDNLFVVVRAEANNEFSSVMKINLTVAPLKNNCVSFLVGFLW